MKFLGDIWSGNTLRHLYTLYWRLREGELWLQKYMTVEGWSGFHNPILIHPCIWDHSMRSRTFAIWRSVEAYQQWWQLPNKESTLPNMANMVHCEQTTWTTLLISNVSCQLPQQLFPPACCTLKVLTSLCAPHSPTTHHLRYDNGYTLKTHSLWNQSLVLNSISVVGDGQSPRRETKTKMSMISQVRCVCTCKQTKYTTAVTWSQHLIRKPCGSSHIVLASIRTTYPTPCPLPSFTHISASTLLTAHLHTMKVLVTYKMQ